MTTPAFPRIFVYGKISWDPSLANNFDIYQTVDARLDRSQIPAGMSLEDFKQQLPLVQRGSWNHYGTHRAVFETVRVTGVSSTPGSVDTTDPIVGKPVQMAGKLVDINPSTDNGTQIFFDDIVFGDALSRVRGQRGKRMTARFINFARNQMPLNGESGAKNASAIWEVSLPQNGIEVRNLAGSGALTALEAALGQPDIQGLSFRFHTYRTLYNRNGIDNMKSEQPRNRADLEQLYGRGLNFSNPAYSIICGVIRPWRNDEHEGHPTGRLLYPAGGRVGKAIVSFDREARTAVLDLGETVPEVDIDLTKRDLGPLELFAEHQGARVNLAIVESRDYDRAAYERTAGLVDIDLSGLAEADWNKVEEGSLRLSASGDLVDEQRFVVVVENRDKYADEGENATIKLIVMDRGIRAPRGTRVQVTEYDDFAPREDLGQVLTILEVGDDGEVDFDVPDAGPSIRYFVFDAFVQGGQPPAPRPRNRGDDFFALVRIVPNDDALEATTSDEQLTWNWVYNTIFAEFDVLNPVMSRGSDPAINVPLHDRSVMESKVARVRAVIAEDAFEQAGYMPVTRDLSRGRRRLLERWCDLVESGNAPPDQVLIAMSVNTRSERIAQNENEDDGHSGNDIG